MKRREFLIKTAAASTIPLVLGGYQISNSSPIFNKLAENAQNDDNILIVVQLNGGNDGLNTVIPLDQYDKLIKLRKTVLLPEYATLSVTDEIGFNPAMRGMHNLHKEGKLLTIQNVGYPEPNYSHFRSTDIWTSGSASDKIVNSGWLGRYLDNKYPGYPNNYPTEEVPDPLSITIGGTISMTCQGPIYSMGLVLQNTTDFYDIRTDGEDTAPKTNAGLQLDYIRTIADKTKVYTTTIKTASDKGKNLSTKYPATNVNKLADQLKIVAQLINGGLKTKVYVVTLGGFDTHSLQVNEAGSTNGVHSILLGYVSQAIEAFQDDLKLMGKEDKVVGMTFSEFGRRITENDSLGTDHGAAAPLFFFGTKINAGILGTNPVISDDTTVEDNLPYQFDFRDVYNNILVDWFNVDIPTAESLMNKEFKQLPIFKTLTSVNDRNSNELADKDIVLGYNYPNPFITSTDLKYRVKSGLVEIDLYDINGVIVKSLLSKYQDKGEYNLTIYSDNLSNGTYYIRLKNNNVSTTQSIVLMK